jgi:hypothetical protein
MSLEVVSSIWLGLLTVCTSSLSPIVMTLIKGAVGLYLSLVMRVSHSDSEDEPSLRLIHLSVQDGSLIHTVPLAVDAATCKGIKSLDMEWCESNAEWPKDAVSRAPHRKEMRLRLCHHCPFVRKAQQR